MTSDCFSIQKFNWIVNDYSFFRFTIYLLSQFRSLSQKNIVLCFFSFIYCHTQPFYRFKFNPMNDEHWLAPKEPVWILRNGTFTKAILESLNNDIAICQLEDGNYAQTKKQFLFQRNPAYKHFDPERMDLMDTDVLNEPEVLKTLKLRLENSRIYTFVQNSVISVNPYMPISTLYLDDLKDFYIQNIIQADQNPRDYQPHIYSIASQMISCLQKTGEDQAVIISGQSGAGKTQANKECLRFLLYYFHRSSTSMDQKINNILSLSNPILQAFGNSKTIRNNNSSRFGKYLSISLTQNCEIKDVKIFNYLLQKSRIISRAQNQQNFHIFYELLGGLSKAEKVKYFLCSPQGNEYKIKDFTYLKAKNNHYQQHPDISFEKVKNSLITLEKEDAYDFMCRVLASILLLGNLLPYESQNEDCCRISNEEVLDQIGQLLKIEKKVLINALTCYPIRIGSEVLTKYFNGREVQQLINSLAKILYEKLFQWIINQINSLSEYRSGENQHMMHLGFLDIYGFEILEQNSLEQLFINYTNERLHQIYLAKIFKEEELLFKREGLAHKFKAIPYEDNLPVLELIDYQQLSIFNLLDEWCSVASPDDSSFITKLRHKHKKHHKFPISNFNLPSTMFLIRHSPKDIEYTVMGFRDKNRDLVREEIKAAVRSSKLSHLSSIFTENNEGGELTIKNNHKFRKFLSSKFRHEINNLITELIGKSNLHFIRCVKSNSSKKPIYMQDEVVYNQICYLGILDTIKLKKIGYCVKLTYQTINKRFRWIVRNQYDCESDPRVIKQKLGEFLVRYGEEEIIYGSSMVFFKDYAFTTLTKKYNQYLQQLNNKCSLIQKRILSFNFRCKLNRFKAGSNTIKKYLKSILANNKFTKMYSGLILIQENIRAKLNAVKKAKRMKNILILQAYIKKSVCKKKKEKVFSALQKIINLIKRYQLRKNVQKFAVINQIKNMLIDRAWKKVVIVRKNIIEKYIKGFMIQVGQKSQIITANYNTHLKIEQKHISTLHTYLQSFSLAVAHSSLMQKITKTQRVITSWLYRQRFVKLRKAAITIQRAYREYYFNKNTARQMFNLSFGQYKKSLQSQNNSIRGVLYANSLQNSLRMLYSSYLGKYHDKCCLFYMIVDFQSLVVLDICYPGNSWLLNYFQVVKETLEKDSPIQCLEVGQTFTVAASTNKLYVWGMNQEYGTFQDVAVIKPNGGARVDKFTVKGNELHIYYQDTSPTSNKQNIGGSWSVSREYCIENGKVFEARGNQLKLLKMGLPSERVLQIACGANHTILRSSSKKIYTFGSGKHGQLGHSLYHNVQSPKVVEFVQFKNYPPVQVSASFNSSIVLLSNKKIYWWGSNGTIDKVKSPILLDITKQFEEFSGGSFSPLRVYASWSRTISVIGLTFIHFNGKLAANFGLRNKVTDLIINKWHQHDIKSINPPFYTAYTDYLEECHVKMPKSKVTIQPQSKRNLKKLEEKLEKVNSEQLQKYNEHELSFSQSYFK